MSKRYVTNRRGVVLFVVLWILAILVLLAVSVARQTKVNLELVEFLSGSVRSRFLAWSGVIHAIGLIRTDSADEVTADFETLYLCGLPDREEVDPSGSIPLGRGEFRIGYRPGEYYEIPDQVVPGFSDEERRFNLNAVNRETQTILMTFLEQAGIASDQAETFSWSLIDWIDSDNVPADQESGAEDDYYLSQMMPYQCKNAPVESFAELMLIRGADEELIKTLEPLVTLYPKQGYLKVNFETAPRVLLLALARAHAGGITNTSEQDAESLVEKMISYRNGDDAMPFTRDDRVIEINEMILTAKEQVIAVSMQRYRARVSNFFRVQVRGMDHQDGVFTDVSAVVDRRDFSVVAWERR